MRARDRIVCVTIDPAFEEAIAVYVDRGSGGTTLTMPASVAGAYTAHILRALERLTGAGHMPVILCSPKVRAVLFGLLSPRLASITVLGYNEIVPEVEVESLALVAEPQDEKAAVSAA